MNYTIDLTSKIFPNCEIIVSTNDRNLASAVANNPLVNKLIISDNIGELPSLKYPENSSKIINNNINKQNVCCLKGVLAASHNIVLRIRTDQVLLNNNILKIWDLSKNFPSPLGRKGKIITSSIFSINPRYSERMPYHISDML
ncbi:TPA: WavE lipopolysaccharide synthesis family protein, partial [Escherichia coli]